MEPLEVKAGHETPVTSIQIRALISERRRRDHFFPADLFGEPAWDMLLELYAASLDQYRITISNLCVSAAVPPTTALRWIGALEQRGVIIKEGDRFDARRVFVGLSSKGKKMVETYFQGEALRAQP
jgi:DNA-binding MarR family transcriptional regulator